MHLLPSSTTIWTRRPEPPTNLTQELDRYEVQRRTECAMEEFPMTADLPEPEAVLDAPGTACAYLTPLIRERIMPLSSGQVLEVTSDDPAAREGVPAWSRLTGNELIASVAEGKRKTRFFLRKK
jgi:TusA-related sulfurtransferase